MSTLAMPDVLEEVRAWKGYPLYRESGAEWLGLIPTHWGTQPLKRLTEFVNGAAFKPQDWADEGVPIIRIENLNGGDEFNFSNRRAEPRYHVHYGDLLFAWSGNRGTSFGPFLWERHGLHYLNQHIFRLTGYRAQKTWLYWVLRGVTAYVEKQAHGIIGLVHITKQELGAVPVPSVPPAEQSRIATFLDRETAKIDALIAKKQRLIELLQERRTALISHAATKGLDPGLRMKESGIEWLGMIPANWERVKFRHAVDVAQGQVDPKDDRFKSMVLIAPNHIESGTGRLLLTETADEQGAISGKYPYRPGDVIYSKIRPELRKACLPSVRGLCSADMYPLSVRRKLLPEYLLYTLLSEYFTQLTVVISERVAMPKVNREDLGECYILVPPLPEQREIVEYLQGSTAKLDALTAKVREALEKLREYRTALISAAVTGKIDVRGEVG